MRALLVLPAAAAAIAGIVSFAGSGGAGPASSAGQGAPAQGAPATTAPPSIGADPRGGAGPGAPDVEDERALGAQLYASQCVNCHGPDGEGVEDRGPALTEEGPASVDFVLRTGRMPLAQPNVQAQRRPPRYDEEEIVALVEHVGSLGDGPAIPDVDVDRGDLAAGAHLYQLNCAACHVATGAGAAIGGGREAPDLMRSTPTQVGEAILIGPGAMPVFGTFSQQDIDDVAAYVQHLQDEDATAPDDLGGAGPVAEGLAAWLLGLLPLVALSRWIGSAHEGRDVPVEPEQPAEGVPT